MGKFAEIAAEQPEPKKKKQLPCAKCGWDFLLAAETKNRDRRSVITTKAGAEWCDTCYSKHLLTTGKMQMAGTPAERVWRDALFPEQAPQPPTPDERRAILDAFAAKLGARS